MLFCYYEENPSCTFDELAFNGPILSRSYSCAFHCHRLHCNSVKVTLPLHIMLAEISSSAVCMPDLPGCSTSPGKLVGNLGQTVGIWGEDRGQRPGAEWQMFMPDSISHFFTLLTPFLSSHRLHIEGLQRAELKGVSFFICISLAFWFPPPNSMHSIDSASCYSIAGDRIGPKVFLFSTANYTGIYYSANPFWGRGQYLDIFFAFK